MAQKAALFLFPFAGRSPLFLPVGAPLEVCPVDPENIDGREHCPLAREAVLWPGRRKSGELFVGWPTRLWFL